MIVVHVIEMDLHCTEGDVNCSGTHFDGDNGIQNTDSSLKWL